MSSSETPGLVRTTGIDPAEAGDVALEEEVVRLRRTVETLEDELARRERERDQLERDLDHTTAWAEFLDRELRAQTDRIESLERERDALASRNDEIVDRYETLLAETEPAGGSSGRRPFAVFDGLRVVVATRLQRLF